MAVDKKHTGTESIGTPKDSIRSKLLDLFGLPKNGDRMRELAFAGRMRRWIAAGMVGATLAQPALQGCSDNNDRPHTPDAGQLPEIDDPAPDEDAAVHRAPDNSVDEEVNILDLDPETGMGLTIRNIANALRITPTPGNIPVVFFNTTNGWKQCGQSNMPENRARERNQEWWNDARSDLNVEQCGTVDIQRELPLGMPWRAEHMFPRIRQNARRPINRTDQVNRRTQIRRAFLDAARHTGLYRYLNEYSPDLAEQFVNLACDGIPALESQYGADIRRSPTGADGIWQIEMPTFNDARDHNRRAWREVFGNRDPSIHNVADASQIAAFIFDDIYRYYRIKWPENHPVFRYPEALLIPLLIAGYNPGRGAAERMFTARMNDPDVQAILNSGDADRIQNEAYITAATGYFLGRSNPSYGTASVGYVPKVYAYHALFQRDVPGEENEVVDVTENPSITAARTQARANLTSLRQRQSHSIASINNGSFNLDSVSIPRRAADWEFVTSDPSQNNAVVYPWVVRNDPFARRYQNGLPTNEALQTVIEREVGSGRLVRENSTSHPEIVFDGDNIPQPWRRVIRTDHIRTYHRLIEEINARMYANGLPNDVMVVPIITSTLRNTSAQRQLRGHSNRSAHPMGAAIDASCRQYAVIRRRADGSYERFVTDNNIGMFFRALVQASAHLARPKRSTDGGVQQGDMFVRFHGPPKHFHMVIKFSDDDAESEPETPAPTPAPPPRRPNTSTDNNRPNTQTGLRRPRIRVRRRPPLRRPRFRPGVNHRVPELRTPPLRRRPHAAPVRRPIQHRVINRRGRR